MNKKIAICLVTVAIAVIACFFINYLFKIGKTYDSAVKNMEMGRFYAAEDFLLAIKKYNYKDTEQLLQLSKGLELSAMGELNEAYDIISNVKLNYSTKTLSNFLDSQKKEIYKQLYEPSTESTTEGSTRDTLADNDNVEKPQESSTSYISDENDTATGGYSSYSSGGSYSHSYDYYYYDDDDDDDDWDDDDEDYDEPSKSEKDKDSKTGDDKDSALDKMDKYERMRINDAF